MLMRGVWWLLDSGARYFVGPHPEALQNVGTEGHGDGNVRRIAAPRDQDAADAALIVAGVEDAPFASDICLEPSREIHRCVHGRHADIAQIAGAITSRNVQTPAKR